MASATQSVRGTNPVAATYDQGSDVQPAVSWTNPNKDSYPKPAAAATVTTTRTTTTTTATATTPASTTAALEKNLNPLDKEDPRLATKALPFGAVDSAELASTVHTDFTQQQPPSSVSHPGAAEYEHNGNILDRTMDQIREWVHSFNPQDKHASQHRYYDEHDDRSQQTSAVDSAKARLADVQQQAASTFNAYSSAAADKAHAMQDAISRQAGGLQARVGDVVHSVSDKASATAGVVKAQVNDFIATHQPSGEHISSSIREQLPSADEVKQRVSAIVPPLAQQASTSYAFMGSFLSQYLSTYRDFVLAMRRQSLPLQAMTALLVVTHFALPWFYVDKSAARSVLSCFVVSSILSHLTYFLSGHLRYVFLAHLVFVPMLISLTLHAGFDEAAQVSRFSHELSDDGSSLRAAAIAPFSLRSYTFVLWLRLVLMVQSALLTLDCVNVLDLLGFSLETRRGQEMSLINRSVAQMRRNFAHSVAPPSAAGLASPTAGRQGAQAARSSQPQSDDQQHVIVQSEEQLASDGSAGLRARKAAKQPQPHQHSRCTSTRSGSCKASRAEE